MRIHRSVLNPKYFTCKEWNRFNKIVERENGNDITAQEVLLKKYDVILTDYKVKKRLNNKDYYFDINGNQRTDPNLTKKELAVKIGKVIYKNANMKNFNKGMKIFDEGVRQFNDSISAFTKELGSNETKSPKNKVKIWPDKPKGIKTRHVPIWSEPKKKKKRKAVHKSREWDKHERNLEKIWGRKK